MIGEGAGIAVLESLDHALARGLGPDDIYAEICGYGLTGDACVCSFSAFVNCSQYYCPLIVVSIEVSHSPSFCPCAAQIPYYGTTRGRGWRGALHAGCFEERRIGSSKHRLR